MGAVVKMGGCRIEGILKIAQRPKHPGFWLLDVIPTTSPSPPSSSAATRPAF